MPRQVRRCGSWGTWERRWRGFWKWRRHRWTGWRDQRRWRSWMDGTSNFYLPQCPLNPKLAFQVFNPFGMFGFIGRGERGQMWIKTPVSCNFVLIPWFEVNKKGFHHHPFWTLEALKKVLSIFYLFLPCNGCLIGYDHDARFLSVIVIFKPWQHFLSYLVYLLVFFAWHKMPFSHIFNTI